jgi:translation initiation factor IF-3
VTGPARSRTGTLEEGGGRIATTEARINDRIRAREVRLISETGEQLGVVPLPEALAVARERELDLVEVAPNASPPVCRIMDYGRWQYEQEQRRKESRRKATNVVIKEMKFRPKIDEHDYETKMKHVQRFLAEGNKVKLTIMFRGREVAHPELGLRILEQIAADVADLAVVESAPRQDGRNMTMVLHPLRRARPARPRPTGDAARTAAPAADGAGPDPEVARADGAPGAGPGTGRAMGEGAVGEETVGGETVGEEAVPAEQAAG